MSYSKIIICTKLGLPHKIKRQAIKKNKNNHNKYDTTSIFSDLLQCVNGAISFANEVNCYLKNSFLI